MDNQTEISSMRNQMFVTFETSTKVTKMGGFRASIEKNGIIEIIYKHFSFLKRCFFFCSTDDSCQYWLNKATLTSPYYPKWFLADEIGCEWIITAPKGHIIALEFEEFEVSLKKSYYVFVMKSTSNVFSIYLAE